MRLGLTDPVAVVTDANSGIGLAPAVSMVAEGARVVTVSRNAAAPGIGETPYVTGDLFHAGAPESMGMLEMSGHPPIIETTLRESRRRPQRDRRV